MNRIPDLQRSVVIFLILVFGPILWLFAISYREFTTYSILYLLTGFILNSALQVAVLMLLARAFGKNLAFVVPLCVVILVAVNFRFNILPLITTSQALKAAFLLAAIAISMAAVFSKSGLKFSFVFSMILVSQALVSQIFFSSGIDTNEASPQDEDIGKARYHRNIFLMGLDSMPGNRSYEKYFNASPPWDAEFERQEFRRIDNAHTGGGTSTSGSYLNLMSLRAVDVNKKLLASVDREVLNRPLPIYRLVRNNGYKIQFMFHSPHLGAGSNQFLDYRYPPDGNSLVLCPFINPSLGFYLCNGKVTNIIERLLHGEISSIEQLQDINDPSISAMMPILLKRIETITKDTSPWVSITHLWEPGHTLGDYRHHDAKSQEEFRILFQQRSERAARDAQTVIEAIKKNDKNPVIIIYADHGPNLSRGWENEAKVRALFSAQEVLDDRQGIGFYVYPKNFCTERLKDGYLLPPLVSDVFSCLDREYQKGPPYK